jgi:hypothetical protein
MHSCPFDEKTLIRKSAKSFSYCIAIPRKDTYMIACDYCHLRPQDSECHLGSQECPCQPQAFSCHPSFSRHSCHPSLSCCPSLSRRSSLSCYPSLSYRPSFSGRPSLSCRPPSSGHRPQRVNLLNGSRPHWQDSEPQHLVKLRHNFRNPQW